MSDAIDNPCAWRDTAWGFVLGSTSVEERESFLEHLTEGCAACGAELQHARQVLGDLDVVVAERTLARGLGAEPSAAIRERLLAGLNTPARTAFGAHVHDTAEGTLLPSSLPGVAIAERSDEGWHATQIDGIEFKTLVEDPLRRTATALVRMAPGSAYPPHRHASREECFVISGDLSFSGHRMEAGDYQVAEGGSTHSVQATDEGCVLLIISSLDDEPV